MPLEKRKLEHPFLITIKDKDKTPLRIKGKIDLVLESNIHNMFVIGDYKAGKTVPSSADIKKFRSLQPINLSICVSKKNLKEKKAQAHLFIKYMINIDATNMCLHALKKGNQIFLILAENVLF